METIYIGNTLINDIFLGSQRMDDAFSIYPKPIPTNGLLAWYDSTYPNSYSGTGTTWFDISGNNRNLIAISGSTFPTYNTTNKDLNFNGSSNALILSTLFNTSSLINTTQVAWVKVARTGSVNAGGFVGIQVPGGASQWDATTYGDQGTGWTLASSDVARTVNSNTTQSAVEYNLIVSTRTSGTNGFKIYRNGSNQIGAGTFTPATYGSTYFTVGNTYFNGGTGNWVAGWFTGSLSMYAVYNRVLSTSEIDDIYNIGRI